MQEDLYILETSVIDTGFSILVKTTFSVLEWCAANELSGSCTGDSSEEQTDFFKSYIFHRNLALATYSFLPWLTIWQKNHIQKTDCQNFEVLISFLSIKVKKAQKFRNFGYVWTLLMDVCHIFANICNLEVIILMLISLLEFRGGLKAL